MPEERTMHSSTAGMPKGGSSGGASAVPPLIDFGIDDHSSGAFVWPDPASGPAQDADPFSWTTDELYISATPKDPFGFEGLFTATPASNVDPFEPVARSATGNNNANNTVYGFASSQSFSGHGGGMDLLTGVPAVVPQAPAPMNPFVGTSSDVGGDWAGSGFMDSSFSVNTTLPAASSSDDSFLFNDNNPFSQAEVSTRSAQGWSSFHEEGSFKDALSEDLPIAESPTSEDAVNAVDWSSIVFAERAGYGNEDRGFVIGNEQAGGGVSVTEKDAFFGTENGVFRAEAANSAKANAVAQRSVPPTKPTPQLPESQSSTWASSSTSERQQPQFLASGGGRGVYRAPSREIFYAGNPVALELRPRPLKLMEVNQSIRTMMCTDTSVWAAFDHGLKVWDIEAACSSCSEGGNNPLGDEDAASYNVLPSGPTLCLAMDTGNQVVWTGHRDGKVRAWPLSIRGGDPQKRDPIDHALVWDAHQAPVTAITITPYGESSRKWNAFERSWTLSLEVMQYIGFVDPWV